MKQTRDPFLHLMGNYIPEPNSGCWLWLGPYNAKGYGILTTPRAGYPRYNKKHKAHRVMLSLHAPLATSRLMACHHCDVPACINPAHLFWGSAADNRSDAMKKKRFIGPRNPLSGEQMPNAKLTDEIVRSIRSSSQSSSVLAAQFGVVPSCIRKIRSGQTWRKTQ